MSDAAARLIAASVLAAGGGLTLGLGSLVQALKEQGGVEVYAGLVLLLVGGGYSVWYFIRPIVMRESFEARPAGGTKVGQEMGPS